MSEKEKATDETVNECGAEDEGVAEKHSEPEPQMTDEQNDIDEDDLQVLSLKHATKRKFPPTCPVWYSLVKLSQTSLDARVGVVRNVYTNLATGGFVYGVMPVQNDADGGNVDVTPAEGGDETFFLEDRLTFAMNCPVTVKGVVKDDPNTQINGTVISPKPGGLAYSVKLLLGGNGIRLEIGVDGNKVSFRKPARQEVPKGEDTSAIQRPKSLQANASGEGGGVISKEPTAETPGKETNAPENTFEGTNKNKTEPTVYTNQPGDREVKGVGTTSKQNTVKDEHNKTTYAGHDQTHPVSNHEQSSEHTRHQKMSKQHSLKIINKHDTTTHSGHGQTHPAANHEQSPGHLKHQKTSKHNRVNAINKHDTSPHSGHDQTHPWADHTQPNNGHLRHEEPASDHGQSHLGLQHPSTGQPPATQVHKEFQPPVKPPGVPNMQPSSTGGSEDPPLNSPCSPRKRTSLDNNSPRPGLDADRPKKREKQDVAVHLTGNERGSETTRVLTVPLWSTKNGANNKKKLFSKLVCYVYQLSFSCFD